MTPLTHRRILKRPFLCRAATLTRTAALGATVAGAFLALPRPAGACGATPFAERKEVLPSDGSTGVPTNTELRVLYFGSLDPGEEGCLAALDAFRLVAEGGTVLDLTATRHDEGTSEAWFVARPDASLSPDTAYELQVNLAERFHYVCPAPAWTTVSRFTTGSGADADPPEFGGATAVTVGDYVDSENTCGNYLGFPLDVELASARDDAPDLRYVVYADGERVARSLRDLDSLFVDCGVTMVTTSRLLEPGAAIEVRAVDLAGNESSAGTALTVDATCDAEPPDALPGDSGASDGPASGEPPANSDGSVADLDHDAVEEDAGSSCAVSVPRRESGTPGSLAVLVLGSLAALRHASRGRRSVPRSSADGTAAR